MQTYDLPDGSLYIGGEWRGMAQKSLYYDLSERPHPWAARSVAEAAPW